MKIPYFVTDFTRWLAGKLQDWGYQLHLWSYKQR